MYVAFNGTSYPGSGPNIIKEFLNEAFASSLDDAMQLGATLNSFPNPANDEIQLDWGMPLSAGAYEVYAYNGQLIESVQLFESSTILKLQTASWNAGSYFIRAIHSQVTVTATFQVAH